MKKKMLSFWMYFNRSDFLRNISYQTIGTGAAQLLPFIFTPALTRLYSEKDFAIYTSFFSISTILAVGAGGRYQLAIIIPKDYEDANKIFFLSIYLTLIYSLFLLISAIILGIVSSNGLQSELYFVPFYVLIFGIWNAYYYLSIRNKAFLYNSVSKFFQSFFYIIISLGASLSTMNSYGLIVARICGVISSAVYLHRKAVIRSKLIGIRHLSGIAHRFKDYPKYGLIPAFLDIASVQGLILILARFYEASDLGYFGLTYIVLNAPLGLIGTSFKDVFLQRITSLVNQKEFVKCRRFFKAATLGLLLIGALFSVIIFFGGPGIFYMAFGEKWVRSGEFASALWPSFLAQFVVSPLSSIFNATNRIKVASIWQYIYFVTTFITLGVSGAILKVSINNLLLIYTIHEVVLYIIYFLLQLRTLKKLA